MVSARLRETIRRVSFLQARDFLNLKKEIETLRKISREKDKEI